HMKTQNPALDTPYPETFFRELSPVWLSYAATLNGAAAPNVHEPFVYLELGCGFAQSTIVNAAAFPHAEFHACDVSAQHVEGARRHVAALSVRNIHLHEMSFERLATQALPQFDFIVLHGVYSWIGAEARAATRRIIRERLKPGGLVYLSYNCLPG